MMKNIDSKVADLWFFVFVARNPKMGILMAVGLYAMAYSDFRMLIGKLIF